MIFKVTALQNGLAEHVNAELALRLPAGIQSVRRRRRNNARPSAVMRDAVHDRLVGDAIVEVLAPGAGVSICRAPLSFVELHLGKTKLATLSAEDAAEHALLRSWLPLSLGRAVAAPLLAGATMGQLAPGAPHWVRLVIEQGVTEARGFLSVELTTAMGEGRAVAYYGPGGKDWVSIRHHCLDGPALVLAGWHAVAEDNPGFHNMLGKASVAEDRVDEAVVHYDRALALDTDFAETHINLGLLAHERGRFDESEVSFHTALGIDPDDTEALLGLGATLMRLNKLEEAEECYERLLILKPDLAEAHYGVGKIHEQRGNTAAAGVALYRAIARNPDYAAAHLALGIVRLMTGDFRRGWPELNWPGPETDTIHGVSSAPLWDGGDLNGQVIVLQGNQGAGDCIQFVRYAPMVTARGGRVIVACRPGLTRLFDSVAGVERQTGVREIPPDVAFRAPLSKLPEIFATTAETIPTDVPYLRADPAVAAAWRNRLATLPGLKVGIAWRGNPKHGNDRNRSATPAIFARFLDLPGLSVVCIQKDARPEELAALGVDVMDAGPDLDDFADTSGLIANLDLVIAVDTSVVHLAGALGAPVWALLAFVPDWRWMLDRDDSPWYPSLRLFRQPKPGDWAAVANLVRGELARHARSRGAADRPQLAIAPN